MGEYATRKSDRAYIKIGTCEEIYYLRFQDIDKVILEGNYSLREPGLWFRLPLPAEDGIEPGNYESYEVSVPLSPYTDPDNGKRIDFTVPEEAADHPGLIQLRHNCGLLLNVRCYHGIRLPQDTAEIQAHWNGKTSLWWNLYMLKHQEGEGLLPIIKCAACNSTFRSDWARVLPHISDEALRDRLTDIAAANPIPALSR